MNAAKRGRPRLGDNVAKRHPLNMKTTLGLRAQLETAAEFSGRTLSHEVEYRLAESFLPNEVVFGSATTQALLRAIAGVIQVVEAATGKSWNKDEQTAELAYGAVSRILPNADREGVTDDTAVARAVILEMLDRADVEASARKKIEKLVTGG